MRAIISGAGIAGLTLAWWLRHSGWSVQLVERATGPRDEGYMIDFVGSGYDVAERMGLLPGLAAIQTTNTVVRYVGPAGRGRGSFDYDTFAAALDGRAFTFMRGDLERVLREALEDGVEVCYGTTVETISEDANGVSVQLSDGRQERADLLVGADGIHSRVRELAFGPEASFLRFLGYHTASYAFRDDQLRQQIGAQFLIVAVPDRQVGLYPTNDGRVVAWLVHRTADPDLPADPSTAIRRIYSGMGPTADRALEHCPSDHGLYYDQVAQIEMRPWSRGRVVLIGDACQAVSLLAGQGASIAMGSAYVLAQELEDHAPPRAAERYEGRLRPHVQAKQGAGRKTAKWLVASDSWHFTVRGLAFTITRLPGGRRLARALLAGTVASVISEPSGTQPGPVGRVLFRLPVLLYQAGLGWLLGDRFMLIEHVGRRTGKPRRTVVEVVEHRADGSYVVASGFGEASQWYRNLQANPHAAIQVGRHRLAAVAERLDSDDGGQVMARYAARHPLAARELCHVMRRPVHDGDYAAVGKLIPFLAFHPA